VLSYSGPTFGEFFKRHKIDIHGLKYQTYGTSKAKKMRAFWEQEPDGLVGKVLSEMLDEYEADCTLNNRQAETPILEKSRVIVARLSGILQLPTDTTRAEETELARTSLGAGVMSNGWSDECKARQAEAIPRWKPWARSSGPKSEAGNATVGAQRLEAWPAEGRVPGQSAISPRILRAL